MPNAKLPNSWRRWNFARSGGAGIGTIVRTVAAFGIVVIFSVSMVLDFLSKTYDPPGGLSTIALAAATYLFGSIFKRQADGG